jgi:hypothetical protein
MFRALAAPILTYGAEVWGPDAMGSLDAALHAPLQVPQNGYLRHLGGLLRSVPAHVLCAESSLPPLARAWVWAGAQQWNRMLTAKPGILRDAWLSDMALAHQLQSHEPRLAHWTWSGAWLRALG